MAPNEMLDDRIAELENKITVSTQERADIMRELDCCNFDKLRAMPPKRARGVLERVRKDNQRRFQAVKKLNAGIEKLQDRLYVLKAQREIDL